MAKYKVLQKFRDKNTKEVYEAGQVIEMTVKRADEAIANLKKWDGEFLERIDNKEGGEQSPFIWGDDVTQLEKLKLQLGITDNSQDDALDLLLDDAESDILTYTNRTELPTALESTQRQLAIIRYNKEGVEGQTAHSEGGISRTWDDDIPSDIKATLNQYRLAKVTKYATQTA